MVDFNADPKIKVKGVKGNVTINFNSDTPQKKANPTEIGKALGGQGAPIGDNVSFSTKAVNSEPKQEAKPKTNLEPKPEVKPEPKPEKSEPKPEPKSEPKPAPYIAPRNVNNGNLNNGTQVQQHGQYNINAQKGSTVIINDGTPEAPGAPGAPDVPDEPDAPDVPDASEKKVPDLAGLRRTADMIHKAIDGIGTDDALLKKALATITSDNIVELAEIYNEFYPDMFENILDDLSGKNFTAVANKFKNVLLKRLEGTTKYAEAQRLAGRIDGELHDTISFESRIAKMLNQMVGYAKEVEK